MQRNRPPIKMKVPVATVEETLTLTVEDHFARYLRNA